MTPIQEFIFNHIVKNQPICDKMFGYTIRFQSFPTSKYNLQGIKRFEIDKLDLNASVQNATEMLL